MPSGLSGLENEIVQSAVRLLSALKAMVGRAVSVASVKPNLGWNLELAKRSAAIAIERQGSRVFVSVLRHEQSNGMGPCLAPA